MRTDALHELTAANPCPELLPALDVEVLRRLLDHEPPPAGDPRGRRRRLRWRAPAVTAAFACAAAAVCVAALSMLPAGDPGALSVADARSAIGHGERVLSASRRPVLFTKVAYSHTGPGQPTIHMVQRLWQSGGQWRAATSRAGPHGVTDVAMLGGMTAYFVASRHTLYINRPHPHGATPTVGGVIPDPIPVELALGALLNVEAPGVSAGAPNFAAVVRHLMALPGARVTRRHGRIATTVTRDGHVTTLVARAGTLTAVSISQSSPDVAHRARDTTSYRFLAFNRHLPPARAARAFDLLSVYPDAKVDVTHDLHLNLP